MVLRDGSTVHIRAIAPEDKAALSQAVESLTGESRYRRFLSAIQHLDARSLAYFTEVDHVSHEALVAINPDDGELVGVARYVRLSPAAETAEVAMFVADSWSGRGLATELLSELAALARAAGVVRFVASCLSVNRDATQVLRSLGPTRVKSREGGVEELSIDLSSEAAPGALQAALGHAASGQLAVQLSGISAVQSAAWAP